MSPKCCKCQWPKVWESSFLAFNLSPLSASSSQPKAPKNAGLTYLSVVTCQQSSVVVQKWMSLIFYFLSLALQVGCLPSARNPNQYQFLSSLAFWHVTKMLLAIEFLAKTVTIHFWYLWISHLSVLEPLQVGFPSLSPRAQKMEVRLPSSL